MPWRPPVTCSFPSTAHSDEEACSKPERPPLRVQKPHQPLSQTAMPHPWVAPGPIPTGALNPSAICSAKDCPRVLQQDSPPLSPPLPKARPTAPRRPASPARSPGPRSTALLGPHLKNLQGLPVSLEHEAPAPLHSTPSFSAGPHRAPSTTSHQPTGLQHVPSHASHVLFPLPVRPFLTLIPIPTCPSPNWLPGQASAVTSQLHDRKYPPYPWRVPGTFRSLPLLPS